MTNLEVPPIWGASTDVREMAIFADRYEMTISLLVFDDVEGGYADWEVDEEDTFDRFNRQLSQRA